MLHSEEVTMKTRILFPAIKGTCFLFLLGVLLLVFLAVHAKEQSQVVRLYR